MSPWLFKIIKDGCMRGMKTKVGNIGARLKLNRFGWKVVACICYDTVLLTEIAGDPQTAVDKFHGICLRRKLRMNAGKSKVMVSERKEVEVCL